MCIRDSVRGGVLPRLEGALGEGVRKLRRGHAVQEHLAHGHLPLHRKPGAARLGVYHLGEQREILIAYLFLVEAEEVYLLVPGGLRLQPGLPVAGGGGLDHKLPVVGAGVKVRPAEMCIRDRRQTI